jgi:K+-sensing histidine kinase KdpD
MSRLIDDTPLLGEAAHSKVGFTRVDLSGWLAEFVARRAEAGDAVHAENPLTTITADIAAPELACVLNNRVDNALRYAGSASIAVSRVDPKNVAIDVVD